MILSIENKLGANPKVDLRILSVIIKIDVNPMIHGHGKHIEISNQSRLRAIKNKAFVLFGVSNFCQQ